MADDIVIRPATPEDLARIAGIQHSAPEAADWNPADYLQYPCVVAECNGALAGFLVTRETVPGETEILTIAVHPDFRRRGIARRLLHPALAGDVFLEVRESNAAARRLYEGAGFQVVGRRRSYYSNPSEDAIVMRFFS